MSVNADFLRSENYKHILFTAGTGGILAGEIALVGDVYALSFITLTAGSIGAGITEADMVEIPKSAGTGLTIPAGKFLYLNTTTKVVSATQGTGDIKVGWAIEAATATATHVMGCWKGGGL